MEDTSSSSNSTNTSSSSSGKKRVRRAKKNNAAGSEGGGGGGGGGEGGGHSSTRITTAKQLKNNTFCDSNGILSDVLLEIPLSQNAEEKLLRQALENSKLSQVRIDLNEVPECPVFYPTPQEFKNPIRYIRSLHPIGEKWGILNVVPPKGGWSPGFHINPHTYRFSTRRQHVHRLQEAQGFDEGKDYTLKEYTGTSPLLLTCVLVSFFSLEIPTPPPNASSTIIEEHERSRPIRAIERRYWQSVKTGNPELQVDYGNDVNSSLLGSGFGAEKKKKNKMMMKEKKRRQKNGNNNLKNSTKKARNLCKNDGEGKKANDHMRNSSEIRKNYKIENDDDAGNGDDDNDIEESPLHLLNKSVPGVTSVYQYVQVPWVYCGMLFSSFCWHTEDNYLPSINYLHKGAPKVWYAAPAQHAKALERTMKAHMPLLFQMEPDLMQKLVTMLDPSTLIAAGVNVCRAVQREGSFIVTFPRGYHCGFNAGYNVAEAVNLAYDEWFPYGRQCVKRYREMKRLSLFPHEWLLLRIAEQRQKKYIELGKEEEFGKSAENKILLSEIRTMFDEEDRLRKKLKKAGVYTEMVMGSGKNDAKGKQHCYLSYMTCFCSGQEKVVCLHHIRYLCACKPSNKALFIRPIKRDFMNANLAETRG
eukprot:jgi/Bigna1/75305/fgenesh1_pg.33_\